MITKKIEKILALVLCGVMALNGGLTVVADTVSSGDAMPVEIVGVEVDQEVGDTVSSGDILPEETTAGSGDILVENETVSSGNVMPEETKEIIWSNDEITVKITADADVLEEVGSIEVTSITEEDALYAQLVEQLEDAAATDAKSALGFYAYDIAFLNAEKTEVYPEGEVKLTVEYTAPIIPAAATAENVEAVDVALIDLDVGEEGAVTVTEVNGILSTEGNAVKTAVYTTDDFDGFALAWSGDKLRTLEYEDDEIYIQLTSTEYALDGVVDLNVTPIKEDNEDTKEQYAEVAQQLEDKVAEESKEVVGFLAYDITLVDAEGNKLEPNGNVRVSMEYKEATIPEVVVAEESIEATEVTVMHHKEVETTEGEIEIEVVDMVAEETIEASVETTESKEVEKAEFVTNSFSVFTITWKNTGDQSVKVYYYDVKGNELTSDKFRTNELEVSNGQWVDLETYATSPVEIGNINYLYKEARIDNPTNEQTVVRVRYNRGYRYDTDTNGEGSKWNTSGEKKVYLIYFPVEEIKSVKTVDTNGNNLGVEDTTIQLGTDAYVIEDNATSTITYSGSKYGIIGGRLVASDATFTDGIDIEAVSYSYSDEKYYYTTAGGTLTEFDPEKYILYFVYNNIVTASAVTESGASLGEVDLKFGADGTCTLIGLEAITYGGSTYSFSYAVISSDATISDSDTEIYKLKYTSEGVQYITSEEDAEWKDISDNTIYLVYEKSITTDETTHFYWRFYQDQTSSTTGTDMTVANANYDKVAVTYTPDKNVTYTGSETVAAAGVEHVLPYNTYKQATGSSTTYNSTQTAFLSDGSKQLGNQSEGYYFQTSNSSIPYLTVAAPIDDNSVNDLGGTIKIETAEGWVLTGYQVSCENGGQKGENCRTTIEKSLAVELNSNGEYSTTFTIHTSEITKLINSGSVNEGNCLHHASGYGTYALILKIAKVSAELDLTKGVNVTPKDDAEPAEPSESVSALVGDTLIYTLKAKNTSATTILRDIVFSDTFFKVDENDLDGDGDKTELLIDEDSITISFTDANGNPIQDDGTEVVYEKVTSADSWYKKTTNRNGTTITGFKAEWDTYMAGGEVPDWVNSTYYWYWDTEEGSISILGFWDPGVTITITYETESLEKAMTLTNTAYVTAVPKNASNGIQDIAIANAVVTINSGDTGSVIVNKEFTGLMPSDIDEIMKNFTITITQVVEEGETPVSATYRKNSVSPDTISFPTVTGSTVTYSTKLDFSVEKDSVTGAYTFKYTFVISGLAKGTQWYISEAGFDVDGFTLIEPSVSIDVVSSSATTDLDESQEPTISIDTTKADYATTAFAITGAATTTVTVVNNYVDSHGYVKVVKIWKDADGNELSSAELAKLGKITVDIQKEVTDNEETTYQSLLGESALLNLSNDGGWSAKIVINEVWDEAWRVTETLSASESTLWTKDVINSKWAGIEQGTITEYLYYDASGNEVTKAEYDANKDAGYTYQEYTKNVTYHVYNLINVPAKMADAPQITVEKTFSGLTQDQIDALATADNPFKITVTSGSGESATSVDLKLNDAGVTKTTDDDANVTYTWVLENYAQGTYTVTESGESVAEYLTQIRINGSVVKTFEDDEVDATGSVKTEAAAMTYISSAREESCDTNSQYVGKVNLIVAKLTGNGGYFVWTPTTIGINERLGIVNIINTEMNSGGIGFSPSATLAGCYFYSGEITETLIFRDGAITYDGEQYLTFDASKQWAMFAAGNYTVTNATDAEIRFENTYQEEAIELDLKKITTSGSQVDGAEFTLYKLVEGTWTAVNNSIVVSNTSDVNELTGLVAGRYQLVETKAPVGCSVLGTSIYFTVANRTAILTDSEGNELTATPTMWELDSTNNILTVKNNIIYSLPSTGGSGMYSYVFGGITLMLGAAYVWFRNRRKEMLY